MSHCNEATPLSRLVSFVAVLVASVLLLGACDSAGPSTEGSNVEVGFGTSYQTAKSADLTKSSHDSLVVSGSNGTLKITDIRLIVSELELEGDADSAEFEAEPAFLDLPLDTNDVSPVAASEIPPATYNEFEFEVEDVDLEENDDDEQALEQLRQAVRNEFPDWPASASMVVVGSFTPDGGSPQSFTAFFEAEIEVEHEISPPLEVDGSGANRALTVRLDPTRWFSRSDGTVQDLSQVGDLTELEVEFEDGVSEIEVDDDDEDDENGDDD